VVDSAAIWLVFKAESWVADKAAACAAVVRRSPRSLRHRAPWWVRPLISVVVKAAIRWRSPGNLCGRQCRDLRCQQAAELIGAQSRELGRGHRGDLVVVSAAICELVRPPIAVVDNAATCVGAKRKIALC